MSTQSPLTLIEVPGTYGDRASREQILRALKECLALVENTPADARLAFTGLRIDVLAPGTREE